MRNNLYKIALNFTILFILIIGGIGIQTITSCSSGGGDDGGGNSARVGTSSSSAGGGSGAWTNVDVTSIFGGSYYTMASITILSEGDAIYAVAFGNGKFVAGGRMGKMATSPDGVNWTKVDDSKFGTTRINAIVFGNGKFVAGGADGKMAYSTDGTNWTPVTNSTFGTEGIGSIAYGNNTFVAFGRKTAHSPDGETWTASIGSGGFSNDVDIAFGNGRFVAVTMAGTQYSSDNGATWAAASTGTGNLQAIAFGNGKFIAAGPGGTMLSSTDGATWEFVTGTRFDVDEGMDVIAFVNNMFVASNNGKYSYSSDGITWTSKKIVGPSLYGPRSDSVKGIAYGNGKYVAVDSDGQIFYSTGL